MKALIQLALSLGVLVVVLRLVSARGARTQAIRRLGIMAFAAFAIWSILFPGVWTAIARSVGVGRGADLVLYVLVIGSLAYAVGAELRFREVDVRFTKLSRRIALDEAGRRHPEVASGGVQGGEVTVKRPEDWPDPDDREAPYTDDSR